MKPEYNVFLRADGRKSVGMGHLNRALLLERMFRCDLEMRPCLVMKEDGAGRDFLRGRMRDVHVLPAGLSRGEEISVLRQLTREHRPSCWVVDVLEHDVDPEYMAALEHEGGVVAAVTDDSHRRVIPADLIVNGNPAQDESMYAGERGRYLCGSPYFLMDPRYAALDVAPPRERLERVLISLGGSDHHNLMFRLIRALHKVDAPLEVTAVVSSATGYVGELQQTAKDSGLCLTVMVDADSLVPFWAEADLAITAGGNTLFERIAARCPGATLCQLPRQMEIADHFMTRGVNHNLGFGPELDEGELALRLKDFIGDREAHRRQYDSAPAAVDGKGYLRIREALQQTMEKTWITNS